MLSGRGRRGAALATVLALVSVVLVIGLAMGSLSTLSLQFNRKQLDSTRAEMAARSGLAHFLAGVQQFEASDDQKINPLEPKPLAMSEIFPHGLQVDEGEYLVRIHFSPRSHGFHSTDNLAGEEPKLGAHDSDGVPRIPPFGLDLMINVEGPGGVHTYRAVLKRYWPFAVYSKHGSLTLMGQPELKPPNSFNQPTRVQGDIYTEWRVTDDSGAPINFEGRVKGYGLGKLSDPSKLLANLEAREGYQPFRVPYHPLILGMRGHLNPPARRFGLKTNADETEAFYFYNPSSWSYGEWPRKWEEVEFSHAETELVFPPPEGSRPSVIYNEVGNLLEGNLYYSHEIDDFPLTESKAEPSTPGSYPHPALNWPVDRNTFRGEIHQRRPPARDPLESVELGKELDDSGFTTIHVEEDDLAPLLDYAMEVVTEAEPEEFEVDDDDDVPPPTFLTETITLTESEARVNGESLPLRPQYTLEGSVSNRQVVFHPETESLFVRESNAGLNLQGVTLRVNGDLDLGAAGFEGREAIQISGTNSTLIVDGKLVLGNAHINAGDQAFVIFAEDIVIKAGGSFRGLLIASRSISILSQDENRLIIEGGIACADKDLGGGITIRGAEVKHEPRYLKGINGAGDFYLASWRKV